MSLIRRSSKSVSAISASLSVSGSGGRRLKNASIAPGSTAPSSTSRSPSLPPMLACRFNAPSTLTRVASLAATNRSPRAIMAIPLPVLRKPLSVLADAAPPADPEVTVDIDRHDEPEAHQHRQHGRAAIGNQRHRHAHHPDQAHHHRHVDEYVKE